MVKIGILGGGQLALMLGLSAISKNACVYVYDENKDVCASRVAVEVVVGSFSDKSRLEAFVEMVDVVVYEFENIDVGVLKQLDQSKFLMSPDILFLSQSRIREKLFVSSLGLRTPRFWMDLDGVELPVIVKQDSLGYDGKGQFLAKSIDDCGKLDLGSVIFEEVIDFDYEVSVIFYKLGSEVYRYGAFRNVHRNSILFKSELIRDGDRFFEHLEPIVAGLDFTGIMCIECFVRGDEIIFNEIAPRVHNSGHLSLKSHMESQFDNVINLCLGYPVICDVVSYDLVLLQVLGQDYDYVSSGYNFFDYGKNSKMVNRKVGHVIGSRGLIEDIIYKGVDDGSFYKA